MESIAPILSSSFSFSTSQATIFEGVDVKAELNPRPFRPPDYEAEHRALVQLAQAMAEHPSEILEKLIEITRDICRAETGGLSLLETHNG